MFRALRRALIHLAHRLDGRGWAHDELSNTLLSPRRPILIRRCHFIERGLVLQPSAPPELLYHCIESQSLDIIFAGGLKPRRSGQVHLMSDAEAALQIGSRYSNPVVLCVHAARMHADGHLFFRADNNLWLKDHVPATYIGLDALGGFTSGPAHQGGLLAAAKCLTP